MTSYSVSSSSFASGTFWESLHLSIVIYDYCQLTVDSQSNIFFVCVKLQIASKTVELVVTRKE